MATSTWQPRHNCTRDWRIFHHIEDGSNVAHVAAHRKPVRVLTRIAMDVTDGDIDAEATTRWPPKSGATRSTPTSVSPGPTKRP